MVQSNQRKNRKKMFPSWTILDPIIEEVDYLTWLPGRTSANVSLQEKLWDCLSWWRSWWCRTPSTNWGIYWCFALSLKFLAWKKLNDSHAWLGRNNEYQLRWNLCFKSYKKQNILSYAPSTDQQLIWFEVIFSKVGKWNPERFLISSRIPQDQNQNGRWNYKLNIWEAAVAPAILTC